MKNIIIPVLFTVMLTSCGGGSKKESANDQTEKKETATNNLSQNPAYQEGLAIVSKSENLCLTCHKIDEKLIGPAYRDVANKYENTEENITMLAKKVKNGGTGVWGDVAMPPNAAITEEDAAKAVKYILLLRNK